MQAGRSGLRVAMIGLRGVPASWGGVERHVEELGARLVDRGHSVTVFARAGYDATPCVSHRGMQVVTLPALQGRGIEAFVHSFTAAMCTVGRRFDVVHFHAIGPGLAAPVSRYLSRAAVVQTVHGLDGDRAKWGAFAQGLLHVGTWTSARVPDVTITVSRALKDHYWSVFGRQVQYVQNGATLGRRVDASVLQERFGLTPGGYVLSVGRLVPEKAADVLLQAYREVPGDLRLVLAGGSSHTDGFTQRVKALAAEDPRVLLVGYVFGDDLAALYTSARAFVLPSLLEGLPLTLLEAVGYSLPLVLSDIPPHLEVVGRQQPGVQLAAAGSVAGLQAAIERSLADPDAERAGARAATERILAHYDWDLAAELLEAAYLDAFDRRGGRRTAARRTQTVPLPRRGDQPTAPAHTGELPVPVILDLRDVPASAALHEVPGVVAPDRAVVEAAGARVIAPRRSSEGDRRSAALSRQPDPTPSPDVAAEGDGLVEGLL